MTHPVILNLFGLSNVIQFLRN